MEERKGIFATIRDFLLRLLNKEFLIFLFFLALSGTFWLAMTLNETMEKEISVPVVITNVPKNVVVASEIQDTVKVTVKDKGYILATYYYGKKIQPISLNFAAYFRSEGHAQVTGQELIRLLRNQLYKTSTISSIKPDKLDIYYNYGTNKKVPVTFKGKTTAAQNYFITHVKMVPDSVTIYATSEQLKDLTDMKTMYTEFIDVSQEVKKEVRLSKVNGVKAVPDVVNVEILADVLTEKTIEVPVSAGNMPEGKVLRTFPSLVKVHFVAPSNMIPSIKASDFTVEADYAALEDNPSEKCAISITAKPSQVTRARLDVTEVDYLIEQQ